PPCPPRTCDHADQPIEDRRPPRHEHHGGRAGLYDPVGPAEQPHDEAAPDHPPAPPQAPREGLEVLEALLQPLGFVLPAAQPEGERALGGGDVGHVRPSSVTRTSTSTGYPARSRAARPPSSRSTTASTPSTRPPRSPPPGSPVRRTRPW